MTLSLRAMRCVQAALQRGSITAAADALHVAPSAIATALDQAEGAFGIAVVEYAAPQCVALCRT
jgi:DNA-binding transcriptional LysR family regulator